jgi:excinuclease UvrABC nuclease subunit
MELEKWRVAGYTVAHESQIPEIAGIYALLKVRRVYGIPVGVEPIYVGQAKNLRRRWAQHLSTGETNPGLQWLEGRVEFWWTSIPAEELDRAEGSLIDALTPVANRRRHGLKQRGGATRGSKIFRRPRDDCCIR